MTALFAICSTLSDCDRSAYSAYAAILTGRAANCGRRAALQPNCCLAVKMKGCGNWHDCMAFRDADGDIDVFREGCLNEPNWLAADVLQVTFAIKIRGQKSLDETSTDVRFAVIIILKLRQH